MSKFNAEAWRKKHEEMHDLIGHFVPVYKQTHKKWDSRKLRMVRAMKLGRYLALAGHEKTTIHPAFFNKQKV